MKKPTLLGAARMAMRCKDGTKRKAFNDYLTYNQYNKLTKLESSGKTNAPQNMGLGPITLVDIINNHGLKPNYSGKQKSQSLDNIRALVSDEVRKTLLEKIYKNQPSVMKAMEHPK